MKLSLQNNTATLTNFLSGFYKLDNLCAIIDVNRLGQSDPAPLQHDMEQYRRRMESFNFHAIGKSYALKIFFLK